MSSSKLVVQGAAGALGGAGLNVEDVFSTYLYTGNGSTQTITNGIDLSGEGGLVWGKRRDSTGLNWLIDTERGAGLYLESNSTNAEASLGGFTAFNSDGFSVTGASGAINLSGGQYASWTFRKAPKFFDVVTYTGNGTAGHEIAHNLGSVPGCIIIKKVTASGEWVVYHRGMDSTSPEDYNMHLSTTDAREDSTAYFNDTAPTSANFTVGTHHLVNSATAGSNTYVAYLFAHNDDDGEFGPDGDADIIKCGSYTGNGSTSGPSIDLGFEPQWVMIKNASTTGTSWYIMDSMRGIVSGLNDKGLYANTSDAESTFSGSNVIDLTATGFDVKNNSSGVNGNGNTIIYIAIRRGPMAVPEDADDVFALDTNSGETNPAMEFGFTADAGLWYGNVSSSFSGRMFSRLTSGKALKTMTDDVELSGTAFSFPTQTGAMTSVSSGSQGAFWKRAPNFFDVVCYKGNAVEGHDIPHNLGAVPEMIWVKNRETASQDWYVYHKDIGNTHYLRLNATSAFVDSADAWNDTTPTDSVFTVGGAGDVNWNNANHIAYLFTSLDGISKVGSYTGNGSSQTIDCGFSSGARFVLIRGYDSVSNNWWVFDSERGIVAGNDSYVRLNETDAEVTSYDPIDPHSSGFIVNNVSGGSLVNYSGRNYIFYAIA